MKALKHKLAVVLLVPAVALAAWPAAMAVLASDQVIYTTIEDPVGFGLQILSPVEGEEVYGDGVRIELAATNVSQIRFYDNGQLILTLDVNESGTVRRSVALPIQQIGRHEITVTAVSMDGQATTTSQSVAVYYMGNPSSNSSAGGIGGGVLPPNTGVFRIGEFVVTSYGLTAVSAVLSGVVIAAVLRRQRQGKGQS
jgi:hypothetical protein